MCNRELMICGIDCHDAALQFITLRGGLMGAARKEHERDCDTGQEIASP